MLTAPIRPIKQCLLADVSSALFIGGTEAKDKDVFSFSERQKKGVMVPERADKAAGFPNETY